MSKLSREEIRSILHGICPECDRQVANYQPPSGFFAPEAYATMREQGIDPATNHRQTCSYNEGGKNEV